MDNSVTANYWAIVPAAGIGRRMGSDTPKQYLPLHGKTIIEQTLLRLSQIDNINGIVVAIAEDDEWWPKLHIDCGKPVTVVRGGAERCHSVQNALQVLQTECADDDWVLVHDAARPCVRMSDIELLIKTLADHDVGGLLGVPVRDTMKRSDQKGCVTETVERECLWHALTPQMFRYASLSHSLDKALGDQFLVTDEASAIEHAGYVPQMVEGHGDNIKITRPEDLSLASFYLQHQKEQYSNMSADGLADGG
ncbi:MAG: 2-C-methyl-D-erythritol 4-phosphate cytidylyltransferase [Desulfobulbaceae bacterium]|nr:2-C-methyl-D-erythritol 4-phosphate cytidylyltransferase [Desulfobulbaceae bacterium]